MTKPNHRIAIIGGGFSGTALATYLIDSHADVTIHLVEPRPQPGWGIAYGGAEDAHILNVPAARMSLRADSPEDFLDWARRHGPALGWPEAAAAHASTYLPRRLFGHYIQTRFEEAQARTAQPVLRHVATATAITPDASGFRVTLNGGEAIHADQVVMATGFAPPAAPFPVNGESRRLIVDPWAKDALREITPDDEVLIIGTGLSMIDIVGSLERARHRGAVLAISRHGLLPRIHGHTEGHPPLLIENDARQGARHSLTKLRQAIRSGQADWRSAMDGLRPVVDILWQALPAAEQDRVLRHLKPYWEVHRHRMPAESADLLFRRVARGLLSVEAARVGQLTLSAEDIEATLIGRGAAQPHHRRFHWVINCTPPAAPLRAPDQLRRSLLSAGLVRSDRTGMGFDVTADGTLRDREGNGVPGFFALGPLRRGQAIETTAVPHLRPQLEALTARLLDRQAAAVQSA